MSEFFRQFSDNQLALMGCLGVFVASFGLLSVSYHCNPANRSSNSRSEGANAVERTRRDEPKRRSAA